MGHIRPVTRGTWLPLYDVAATRRIETAALAEQQNDELIRRAGLSVAKLAMAIAPHGSKVWVACGPGNNGADGLEAAVHPANVDCRCARVVLKDPEEGLQGMECGMEEGLPENQEEGLPERLDRKGLQVGLWLCFLELLVPAVAPDVVLCPVAYKAIVENNPVLKYASTLGPSSFPESTISSHREFPRG